MSASAPRGWPGGNAEKDAVLAQLGRVLEHSAFKNSQRSARFLRYVVEYALVGNHETRQLKERTLGAELFGLDPAYDTNQYTIVRNAATDVRKRLAMYYHEPGHEDEIQIDLPAGSYMPAFHPRVRHRKQDAAPQESPPIFSEQEMAAHTEPEIATLPPTRESTGRRPGTVWLLIAGAALAVAVIVLWLAWRNSLGSLQLTRLANMSDLDQFWQPVLDDAAPEPIILLCVGNLPDPYAVNQQVMPVGDAFATADLARRLGTINKRFRIATASTVSMTDLQPATVLLVGGIDNPWTLYATDGLRFHFSPRAGANAPVWIEDSKNPSSKEWLLAPLAASGSGQSYALIARFIDPRVGRWRVVVAGLDGAATGVAARILVDPNYLKELTGNLPRDWQSRNLEAVISVPMVNGEMRFPRVAAYEIW
jgi:hypothetical protein